MSTEELNALAALTFNWTRALDDVWAPSPYHVEGLHADAAGLIQRGIDEARAGETRPLGLVLLGERGVGKTHLLGWTRERVQEAGGYFFLVGNFSGKVFWEELLGSVVEQLLPLRDGSRNQLGTLLASLADRAGLEEASFRAAVTGQVPPSRDAIKVFIAALRRTDPALGLVVQDTARALILLASPLQEDQDVGYYFLTGEEVDVEDRRRWGINSRRKQPRFLLGELSQLLALTGPTVLAVDQIDALIDELAGTTGDAPPDSRELADTATGLMMLRDLTRRTLTLISALPESWDYVRNHAVDTMADRFRVARQLRNIPTAGIGRLMIEKRFATDYARAGFDPPYPSWPILPAAFEDASRYTARGLLKRIEAHVTACLHERAVAELGRLEEDPGSGPGGEVFAARHARGDQFADLDAEFAKLRDSADVTAALDAGDEDMVMPALLSAGLAAWIRELGADVDHAFVQDPLPGKNPRLHACLRMVLDSRTERHRRWSFRAIAAGHPRAVQSRLRKALDAAGLEAGAAGRHLFVLRDSPWPGGPATAKIAGEFAAKGGVVLPVPAADLKILHALGELLEGHHPDLNAWLVSRQPAHGVGLLSLALGDASLTADAGPEPDNGSMAADDHGILAGTTVPGQVPVRVNLESLRRHVAVFAGSGSGKTVLLRRIIEECALRGVSSIVLDPNNDLARMAEAWPQAPEFWADGDSALARDYLASTEVVLWTPGRQGGRPLAFRPLPAFAEVRDDPDELDAAVNAAVEALAPRLNVHKQTVRADQEKAVLREALEYFARGHGPDDGLDAFVELLGDLPQQASSLWKASVMAADLAQRLQAVRVNDPLFGGAGEPADPGTLLAPSPGMRARVSVISMVGLPSLEQRQGFVNQLQMALFSWIKRHPAGERPLGGLFVMDEAQDLAPSGRTTACTESTLRLASQARKYGLGLLFATQSPKALHNRIPGNATTQFYGLLNSPAQIDAARDLAKAKGGDVPDIGRMRAGEFYIATEGSRFRKIRTPMCLSYHPSSPLTEEEVIERAATRSLAPHPGRAREARCRRPGNGGRYRCARSGRGMRDQPGTEIGACPQERDHVAGCRRRVQPRFGRPALPRGQALVPQQADTRMISRVAARGGLERVVTVNFDAGFLQGADDCRQQGAAAVRGDRRAVTGEPVRLHVPHARAGGKPVRGELDIAGIADRRADVSLVGGLIATETNVPVWPEDLRLAELWRQLLEEFLHGPEH